MRIELSGWESQGLRCPDMKVDLSNGDIVPRCALVQMPNGTGKTTTLTMLRAVLSGEATQWDAETISGFRRPGEIRDKGSFVVNLRVDGKPLTFELVLNFDDGNIRYRTTAPGSGGISNGWNPPTEVRRFLDKRFIKLFIFDGELADKLLDHRESEATKAIDALCQLYLLQDIADKADENWQIATKNVGAKTDIGLNKWQSKVDILNKRIKQIEDKKEKANIEIRSLEIDVRKLEKKIQDQIGTKEELRREFDRRKEEEDSCNRLVEETTVELMNQIRKPQLMHNVFPLSLIELKSNLDRLKLPSSSSKQFFDELVQEDFCICGRQIDETARNNIIERSKKYLGEEIAGVLNALKQDISKEITEDIEYVDVTLEKMNQQVKDLHLAKTAVRALKQRLIDEGDEKLKEWQDQLEEKIDRKEKLERLLLEINSDDDSDLDGQSISIKSLNRQLKQAEKKLSEISGTIDLKRRTDILKKIVLEALRKARVRIKKMILNECNQRLEQVLSQDPIKIDNIESSLSLLNQDGASAGQTLAVGYIFLTTLLNRGAHKFPLIVDSPAHNLSIKVRREIGDLVPNLCDQFITFTTSSERIGFVPSLHEAAQGEIKYLTIFRKTEGTEYLMDNLPKEGCIQTINGVLIEGEDYFNCFDIEEEIEED